MNEHKLDDSVGHTIAGCAWLIDIAQRSADYYGRNSVIVRYLDRLGECCLRNLLCTPTHQHMNFSCNVAFEAPAVNKICVADSLFAEFHEPHRARI